MAVSSCTPDISKEGSYGRGPGRWAVELSVELELAPLHWRYGSRKHMHLETKRGCPVFGGGLGEVIRGLGH